MRSWNAGFTGLPSGVENRNRNPVDPKDCSPSDAVLAVSRLLADPERASAELAVVERMDRGTRLELRGHFHDAEPAVAANEGGVGGTVRLLKNIAGMWLVQECRRQWVKEGHDHSYAELKEMAGRAKPFGGVIDPDHKPFLSPGDMPNKIEQFCKERKTLVHRGSPDDLRQHAHDQIKHRGLVVLRERLGLEVHGLGLGLALGEDRCCQGWDREVSGAGAVAVVDDRHAGEALPPLEAIEEPLVDHGLELGAEGRVHPVEHGACPADEVLGGGEGAERRLAVGIHRQVPRAQRVELQVGLALPVQLLHQRHARLLDRRRPYLCLRRRPDIHPGALAAGSVTEGPNAHLIADRMRKGEL